MDSTSSSTHMGPSLLNLINHNSQFDAWRCFHAGKRDFSFFSTPHWSFSRIDLFLVDQGLLTRTISTKINNITWSDHASVVLTIADSLSSDTIQIWRANPLLLHREDTKKTLERHLTENFTDLTWNICKWLFCLMECPQSVHEGIFIKLGAGVKRQQQKQLRNSK